MLRIWVAVIAAVVVFAVVTTGALAFGGPNPPEQAVGACGHALDIQIDNGTLAGGGPKVAAGEFGQPLNCDHFFQNEGFIGNGPPGP